MTATVRPDRQSLFDRRYALATVGSSSLVFLAAFEALAVTTIMPIVTADLDGRRLYSLAFAATMAAGVLGMVAAGASADRRGPARPLLVAVGVFAVGLAIAGCAPTMTVFVAARFLQGLGAGGVTVALYVLVAGVYPGALHPRIFGLFAAAWVVPSMVGPPLAGVVAETIGWRWVFLGVVALVGVATALIVPVTRGATAAAGPPAAGSVAGAARRIVAAAVVAAGAVTLSLGGTVAGRLGWLVAAGAVGMVAVAARGLLPAGTYRAAPGLPATIALCATAGGTFFSAEVYLPLLLHDEYALPSWLSGGTLTAGALAWAFGSDVQGRFGARLSHRAVLRVGAALLAAGALAELATAALMLHPACAAGGWLLAGAGMGLLYPRVSTLVLAESSPGEQGANTAAKSIADAIGGSVALAGSGLLFGSVAGGGGRAPFVLALALSSALGILTVLVSGRAGGGRVGQAPR